ncbi:serine hydrolase [bacterium]|nr:serine hydrolase [bacterium]
MIRILYVIKHVVTLGILFSAVSVSAGTQETDTTDSDLLNGLSEFVEKKMDEWNVPGLAIGVIKGDQTIFLQGFGYRDFEKKLPVTPQTLFKIGSVSKPFTALSAAQLVDQGKLDWDTPVIEYLKDFRLYDDYATTHATPRDLLSHRTGMPGHYMMFLATNYDRQQIYNRLRFLEPIAGFREMYLYSNLMYMTAGYLVGRVSGGTWEEYVTQRIFTPLGMIRSTFSVSAMQQDSDFALAYENRTGDLTNIPIYESPASTPAGGIISSAEEMLAWLKVYTHEGKAGEKEIVSATSLIEMFTPQIPIRYVPNGITGPVETYGLGWTIRPYRGYHLVHHGGWIDGFVSWVSVMPQKKIAVVVLSNKGNQLLPFYLNYHIYHRLLGLENDWTLNLSPDADMDGHGPDETTDSESAHKTTHPLKAFTGVYQHPAYGQIEIIENEGVLNAIFNKDTVVPLRHAQYNIFRAKHDITEFNELHFCFPVSLTGTIESLQVPLQPDIDGRSIGDIVFTRVADTSLSNREYLQKYTGIFQFQDMQVEIKLVDQGKLFAYVPGQKAFEMEPFSENVFKLKGTDWDQARIEYTKYDKSGLSLEGIVHLKEGSLPIHRLEQK